MKNNLTPMMQQYLELKEKHNDCLLFFRLGDFYEMFFEDAVTASRELEIVLTGRDCGLTERAPMCGVPHHSVDAYINRLIKKGYKVAICEQITDPADSKGIVQRDVIRVITPGTIIEESMLQDSKNNYIASLCLDDNRLGVAYCDVSTGEFTLFELEGAGYEIELMDELSRIMPTEIIANDALFLRELLAKRLGSAYYIQCYDAMAFALKSASKRLCDHFSIASLASCNCENRPNAIAAAGALLKYLEDTQKNALSHIKKLSILNKSSYMYLDETTRRNLELTEPIRFDASKKLTLLNLLDQTNTAMGGRLLRAWIGQPLQHPDDINYRLDAISELLSLHSEREAIGKALDSIYDIERLCSGIAYGTITPRDCVALRTSLGHIPRVINTVNALRSKAFCDIAANLDPIEDIYSLLCAAIVDEPPVAVKEGGIIKAGYNEEVDKCREAAEQGKNWLGTLEARERSETGIKNLKVGYNRIFGYYIEVTKANIDQVPYHYQRRQTLANCERYTTSELKELEETILGADEKCMSLEFNLFCEIREMLLGCIDRLQNNAKLIALLDVLNSLSQVAFENRYCRPAITKNGVIEIIEGRHPVVEKAQKGDFIPNNAQLDNKEDRVIILTGPNMAGKSTYMRQVALITLMAHIGSFVPAKAAAISIVDRIFTRIGASDSLATGQSTFMVEMNEVSNILNNATKNSLLILDEIGRGTSTFDGLSIAWSVLEYIADPNQCGSKALFATHYHELTELEGKIPGIKNYRISVKEVGEDIIFLRKIVRGGADKSFGVQVARLAGLPDKVLDRAKEILKKLEAADINHELIEDLAAGAEQMTLFGSTLPDDILNDLVVLDLDTLTPVDALNKLYDLHLRAKLR